MSVRLSVSLSASQLAQFFIFFLDRILWPPESKANIDARRGSLGAGHKTIDYSPPGRKRNQTNSIYGNLHAASFRVD